MDRRIGRENSTTEGGEAGRTGSGGSDVERRYDKGGVRTIEEESRGESLH